MAKYDNECVTYFQGLNSENNMTISWLNYSLAKWQSLGGVNKKV